MCHKTQHENHYNLNYSKKSQEQQVVERWKYRGIGVFVLINLTWRLFGIASEVRVARFVFTILYHFKTGLN